MTALQDTVDILMVRHAEVAGVFELEGKPDQLEALASETLGYLSIDPALITLPGELVPSVRLALDVVVWAWVEGQAALAFDFSADGGSYQRSQLMENATRMRRRAEDRATSSGLGGFGWPPVEVTRLVGDSGLEWTTYGPCL